MQITPLESFITHKAQTGMQCGNYSIDLPELKENEQYRFHFDATACVGCRCCEVACNEQNNNPADIKWRRVGEMEGGTFPDVLQLFNSMSCNHCVDPACLIGCPTESYIKFDNGIVFHDDPSCIGCQYCTWNCPYGVPTYHEERKIVTKCHMCYERIDEGQSPACVQACPSGAIMIESVNIDTWLAGDIDTQGNVPQMVDARVTNATTRFTLPDTIPETMTQADDHHLKAFHKEMPLVFMTILTQVSLGAFSALFLGHLLSFFGLLTPTWIMAIVPLVPIAIGLPLSALHLGRPIKAMSAMKNWRNSWLSREAIALALFALMITINILFYFIELPHAIHLAFETVTLSIGILGIYAQSMIYRIVARPSWNRMTTNIKFFTASYIGLFLFALVALADMSLSVVVPLLSVGLVLATIHAYASFEEWRTLSFESTYQRELQKTKALYEKHFKKLFVVRIISFVIGAFVLPVIATVMIAASVSSGVLIILGLSLAFIFISELIDRMLFYATSVGLDMMGSFFVGKQR